MGNFFDNLAYPGVILNDLLQGKVGYAADGTARLLVNTTLGVGGLMDPASRMGLAKRNEDFGQTLGYYGAGSGAYLMLPALGPSSARDVTRYPVEYYTDGMNYLALSGVATGGLVALNIINTEPSSRGRCGYAMRRPWTRTPLRVRATCSSAGTSSTTAIRRRRKTPTAISSTIWTPGETTTPTRPSPTNRAPREAAGWRDGRRRHSHRRRD
ncbi:MAG: VacJ family lipoprotein [Arhodomonas sp.]|nr:VacJ family lipoprotein [Arhodomonas sp.]